MKNIQNLELSALVDLLAQHTTDYTRMLTEGGDQEEFDQCKSTIDLLQKEIETRKQDFTNNATVTGISPDFNE